MATVNFGHKKTQPKLGRCVGYLSVVMHWMKDLYKKPPDGGLIFAFTWAILTTYKMRSIFNRPITGVC